MVLRKTTIDYSVRYVSKIEKTQERDIKPKTIKKSFYGKQNKKLSQSNEKFGASGFGLFTK